MEEIQQWYEGVIQQTQKLQALVADLTVIRTDYAERIDVLEAVVRRILHIQPETNRIVIAVRQSRVCVCRFIEVSPFTFETEDAVNWRALEPVARRAVEAQIGAIVEDDLYPCPPEIADLAEWS